MLECMPERESYVGPLRPVHTRAESPVPEWLDVPKKMKEAAQVPCSCLPLPINWLGVTNSDIGFFREILVVGSGACDFMLPLHVIASTRV